MCLKKHIAISVAQEDIEVAKLIAAAFKKNNISYYLYTEHKASNWGNHILKITQDKYGAKARYVLLIISEVYVKKYWSGIENMISQVDAKKKDAFILPLRLDDTPVDGLSKHIVYVVWNNNPDELAELVKDKLALHKKRQLNILARMALCTVLLGVCLAFAIPIMQNRKKQVAEPIKTSLPAVDTPSTQPTGPGSLPAETSTTSSNTTIPILLPAPKKTELHVEGQVVDEETGDLLDDARVTVNGKVAYTKDGNFSLQVPVTLNTQNNIVINCSKKGYEPVDEQTVPNITIENLNMTSLLFKLKKTEQ